MLSLIFWLQEIDETKSRQCRAISFLDRDPLRNEVQLTQIVFAIRFLVEIINDPDQTLRYDNGH